MRRYEEFKPTVVRIGDGEVELIVAARERIGFWTKINLWFWITNDWDPEPPDWHDSGKSKFWRYFTWYVVRNPGENFKRWVLGLGDRNYTVRLWGDSWWTTANTTDNNWEIGYLKHEGFYFPWMNYSSRRFTVYVGWQPVGVAAIKLNNWALLLVPLVLVVFPLMILWRMVHAAVRGL